LVCRHLDTARNPVPGQQYQCRYERGGVIDG
jgi:hypothetical protein